MTNDTAATTTLEPPAGSLQAGPLSDPRPLFNRAVALAAGVIAQVTPDQFDEPTPCEHYDVHDLLSHLVGVVRGVATVGRVGSLDQPQEADDVGDEEWAAAWAAAVDEVDLVWSEDAVLDRELTLPFAVLPARVALVMYVAEITIHTWDLATATGHRPMWDEDVVTASYGAVRVGLPADNRGGDVPFGPVVDVPDDAPEIDRLVAWTGRRPRRPRAYANSGFYGSAA